MKPTRYNRLKRWINREEELKAPAKPKSIPTPVGGDRGSMQSALAWASQIVRGMA